MTAHRLASLCLVLGLLAPPTLAGADPERWDVDHLYGLAVGLGEAADEGYRLQRTEGDGTSTRLAARLRRLRIQTRRLCADLEKGRGPRELRTLVLTIQGLARDVAEEATEGFNSARFSDVTTRMLGGADEIASFVADPAGRSQQVALEADSRPGR